MLLGVPHTSLDEVWDKAKLLLEKAYVRGERDYNLDDIRQGLLSRDYQLWVWVESGEILAACITCIVIYPRRKICALMMIGGKGLHLWKDEAQKIIVKWAKDNGCSALEGYQVRAWLRVLRSFNWRVAWTTIRKDI